MQKRTKWKNGKERKNKNKQKQIYKEIISAFTTTNINYFSKLSSLKIQEMNSCIHLFINTSLLFSPDLHTFIKD